MFNNIHISSNAETVVGRRRQLIAVLCITAGALVVVALWYIIFTTDKAIPALNAIVRDAIPYSSVTNPVTAVLLNFRSYDTLLEIVVLVLVAMAQRTPRITFTPTALYPKHAAKLLKQWLAPLISV
jgi:multisubunit Na+/H+ antiporter MnhB subunit